ncbi:MAG: hypothetical protein FWE80_00385 [Oscillospiraceae bacterium]|nr:hypothetical protein [Oscillospiraceae bacterium]
MSKYCPFCETECEDHEEYCWDCGYKLPPGQLSSDQETSVLNAPVQPFETLQPSAPEAIPYEQSYQPDAAAKKKLSLPLIIAGIAAVAVVVVLLLVLVVFNSSENTAGEDYYLLGSDRIPSVRLALGADRKIESTDTQTNAGVTTHTIKYQIPGKAQYREMFNYKSYLCGKNGFSVLDDKDFNGSAEGTIQLTRASDDSGNEILLRIDYDADGYTVTIIKQPQDVSSSTAEPVTTPTENTTGDITGDTTRDIMDPTGDVNVSTTPAADPWVGLWRWMEGDEIVLLLLDSDNTVIFAAYNIRKPNDKELNFTLTGRYSLSGGNITMNFLRSDGSPAEPLTLPFKIEKDVVEMDEDEYYRLPMEDKEAIFADPLKY